MKKLPTGETSSVLAKIITAAKTNNRIPQILGMRHTVSVRYQIVLSDDLNREINQAVAECGSSRSEIFRKALQLYLAARDGSRRGLKLGLVEPATEKLQTEIVGL